MLEDENMYNTVIFDLDGTLLNSLDDLADSVNYVQKKYDFPVDSIDVVRQHVGNGIRNLIMRSIPDGENNECFEQCFADFKAYYQQHCEDKTDMYPGIRDLLVELKSRGIKMAIVSNKAHPSVLKLHDTYFKEYIDMAFGENEDAGIKKKPAPDMVWHAMEELGSTKEETLYVGDSDIDKMTADNSGIDCVLCQWGFRSLELLQKMNPKAIIATPDELLQNL